MSIDSWHSFLQTQSAVIADQRVSRFNDDPLAEKRAALRGNILCDLSHYGIIRISGKDAQSFLQNQFCNDVAKVDDSHSQFNGYCTPKGRALAFFRLFKRDDAYYMRLPRVLLTPTLKRLQMYVLMSKVKLEDGGADLLRIGLAGGSVESVLQAVVGSPPTDPDAVVQTADFTLIRAHDAQPRYEIYGSLEAIRSLWPSLADQARPVGADVWDWLDIQAGIPEVLPETVEAFVPQMLNLQAIDALSFKKGCYPGQEIVARMHYLGKLKRRMYLGHADTDTVPAPGTGLFAAEAEGGQGVGKVVRAQLHPEGGVDLLAVIEIASAADRPIHLENSRGALMNLADLPYILEDSGPNQK